MSQDFDKKAAGWDQQAYRVDRARTIAGKILAAVPLGPKAAVLDFGCGTGLLGFEFLPRAGTVTFADTSAGMLDQVRAKAAGPDSGRVRTVHLPGQEPVGPFDLVASLMVLHHIEDHRLTVERLAAVVRPGGTLCLSDLDAEDGNFHTEETVPHNGFDRSEIQALLEDCGLEVVLSCTGYVNRKQVGGVEREFPVFLIAGRKTTTEPSRSRP